jgi:hypothetical protein
MSPANLIPTRLPRPPPGRPANQKRCPGGTLINRESPPPAESAKHGPAGAACGDQHGVDRRT